MTPAELRDALRFDRFVLLPAEGRLLSDGTDIPLAPKPFETLLYLVRHAGHVVSKQELLDAVWPETFITEDGLVQCVVEIRRALGDAAKSPRYVQTVPKRGYRFLASVLSDCDRDGSTAEAAELAADVSAVPGALPDAPAQRGLGDRDVTHPPIATSPRTTRRLWIAATIAILLLVAGGVAVWRWWPSRDAPSQTAHGAEPGLVVMLPVQMVDGLDDLGWLRTGLIDVLAAEITRWPDVRLVPRHQLEAALERLGLQGSTLIPLDRARDVARALGAGRLISGSIQRVNERFVVQASIVEVTSGRRLREVAVHGDRRADLLDALGRFSHEVGESLGSAGTAPSPTPAPALATKSLAAYRAYSGALEREERGGRAESAEAEARLQEAIAEDPTFARAYVRLALVQQARRRWGYGTSDPRPAIRAARKRSGDLPERDRLLLGGLADLLLDGDSETALDSWTTLLRLYPAFAQESSVPTLIADTLMQEGRWAQMILATENQVDAPAVPQSERALLHSLLAKAFRKQGEFDRAIAHASRAAELWPAPEGPALLRVKTLLGRTLVDAGRRSEAIDVFRQVAADPRADVVNLGDAGWGLYMAGLRAEAAQLADRAIRTDPAYGNAYHLRGWLQLTGGRPAEAVQAFDDAYAKTPVGFGVPEQGLILGDVAALYYSGVAAMRAGNADAAHLRWHRVLRVCQAASAAKGAKDGATAALRWHASYCAALAAARLEIPAASPGRLEGDDATYFLLQARLESVRHHPGAALAALRQAVSLRVGDMQHIADDPNFESIAGDPVFQQLIVTR